MRNLIIVGACVVLCGCGRDAPPRLTQPLAPTAEREIPLRPGDGRVYVIKSPDPLGIDTVTCFLHIADSGAGAIACQAPRLEITEQAP